MKNKRLDRERIPGVPSEPSAVNHRLLGRGGQQAGRAGRWGRALFSVAACEGERGPPRRGRRAPLRGREKAWRHAPLEPPGGNAVLLECTETHVGLLTCRTVSDKFVGFCFVLAAVCGVRELGGPTDTVWCHLRVSKEPSTTVLYVSVQRDFSKSQVIC